MVCKRVNEGDEVRGGRRWCVCGGDENGEGDMAK